MTRSVKKIRGIIKIERDSPEPLFYYAEKVVDHAVSPFFLYNDQ
jgi:hypothetical protein